MSFNPSDKTSPAYYGPSQTALLLLDFHGFLLEKALPGNVGQNVVQNASKLRDWAKSEGILIIHGLVDAEGTPFPTCKDQTIFANVAKMFNENNGGDEPAVLTKDVGEDELTFLRVPGYVSALKSAGLPQSLMTKDITSLLICGISTSGCVLRTAVAATDFEFVVTVIEDGCADPDQEVHDVLVKKVLPNRGYVTTAAGFMAEYEKAKGIKA